MSTAKCPLEILLLAWLIIVVAILRLLSWLALWLVPDAWENFSQLGLAALDQALLPLPFAAHIAFSVISSVLMLAAASAVLAAKNWGRWVVLLWGAVALIFSYVSSGAVGYLVPKLVVYGLFLIILLSPRANRYFP